jgi:hypothetical protein
LQAKGCIFYISLFKGQKKKKIDIILGVENVKVEEKTSLI